jgi:hypothetical protein
MNLPTDFVAQRVVASQIALRDGWHAPVSLYASVYQVAAENVPTLKPGLRYKAEHVCGPNFWLPMSATFARLAGRCFHDMVWAGLLPLEVVPGKSATLRYRLI